MVSDKILPVLMILFCNSHPPPGASSPYSITLPPSAALFSLTLQAPSPGTTEWPRERRFWRWWGWVFSPRLGKKRVSLCALGTLGQDWWGSSPTFFLFFPLYATVMCFHTFCFLYLEQTAAVLWHSVKEKLCMNWEGETFTLSSLSCLSHLASRLDGDARRTQEKLAKRALGEPRALPPLHPARHSGQVPHGREVKSLKCCLIRFISAWQLFSEL